METKQTVAPSPLSAASLTAAFEALTSQSIMYESRGIGKSTLHQYFNENIALTPTMDEFQTKIMQERIKTCKGRIPADEYFKYCKEINNTYTNAGIKGSKLCQTLFRKRPTKYRASSSVLNFEKHVRKKPQWTDLNTQ